MRQAIASNEGMVKTFASKIAPYRLSG